MLVLPCIEASDGDVDGIPNVLIEAMACHVAVVSSDLPAIRELVSDGVNGLLARPGDVSGLAAALARLLDAPKLRDELADERPAHHRRDVRLRSQRQALRGGAVAGTLRRAQPVEVGNRHDDAARVAGSPWPWAPYSRRSEMFARELGGQLHCIHYLKFRSPPYAPFKYVLQAVQTLRVLFAERPQAVHVQNPPFICGCRRRDLLPADGRALRRRVPHGRVRPSVELGPPRARSSSRAELRPTSSPTNIGRSWCGRGAATHSSCTTRSSTCPRGEPFVVSNGFNVAFLSTFAPDEPLDSVLEAAAMLPDVHFYVTGDTVEGDRRTHCAARRRNVTFTGFLDPNGTYLGLLRAVDAALVLTTRDHTLQLAGCEAIALGKPLVTSDFAYLRALFEYGAVFVDADCRGASATGSSR